MPFGLSTCPSTFMWYINAIFRHLISKSIVLPYMDDIVIPAANESQALGYLKIVLQVLDESRSFFRVHTGYFSNIPKCIKAEFIASWACSQSSVVSSSQR
ncbi:hypothetical protein TNCV_3814471 [Trichonephila clavipes]|nr:hypothetical protein TNCV_3814471 [Trichonephila clavipes]